MASDSNKIQIIVGVLGFAGVIVTTVSSNWDKLFPRPALTPPATSMPRVTPAPPDTTPSPDTSTPRLTPMPRVTPIPHVNPTPRVAPARPDAALPGVTASPPDTTPSPAPAIPPGTTTRITSPPQGAKVGQKIAVEGVVAGLRPDQHVFLCVKSQAFGRLIYPQGQIMPDATGKWVVESIYGSPGYSYETFVVVTTDTASAALLRDPQARKYGMRGLPSSTAPIGPVIVVTRE